MSEHALVTNFAYGTGPYLRTTELALAFNDELAARGRPRMTVIVPWIYGEKQRAIMLEEFGEHARRYPGEILLDPGLGRILRGIFYTGSRRYEEALRVWTETAEETSRAAQAHLGGRLALRTLLGADTIVEGATIALELNRSPRVRYGIAPAYSTTFGYVADILERASELPSGVVDADPVLLRRAAALGDSIEGSQELNCMAFPATFSWRQDFDDRYGGILVPPITNPPTVRNESIDKEGIFVTVTGIEGLERLYEDAARLGLTLYSNDIKAVPGSVKALPSAIAHANMKLHFARAGWGSLWLSMFVGIPVVVPQYDATDDPEIYFNNAALEELGFGVVYKGQPLRQILATTEACRARAEHLRAEIMARWGTLNGNRVCAKMFADRFLSP